MYVCTCVCACVCGGGGGGEYAWKNVLKKWNMKNWGHVLASMHLATPHILKL